MHEIINTHFGDSLILEIVEKFISPNRDLDRFGIAIPNRYQNFMMARERR